MMHPSVSIHALALQISDVRWIKNEISEPRLNDLDVDQQGGA